MKVEPDNAINTCIDSLLVNPRDEVSWLYLGLAFELKEQNKYKLRAWDQIDLPIHFKTYYDKNLRVSTSTLGFIYFSKNQDDKAIETYKKVIRLNPDYAQVWILLGKLYFRQNQYDEAINACKKALEIDPEYIMALNELGYIYGKMEKNNMAIDAFTCAIDIDSEYYFAWNNLAWIYNKQGEYNKAIDACLQALNIKPESGATMSHFGYGLYKKGDVQKGLELIQRSLELIPDNSLAREHLEEVCKGIGIPLESINQRIESRIEQDENNKKNQRLYHLYKLAKFLYSVKFADKALVACNLCLEIDPSSKKLLKLKQKIKEKILPAT